MPRFLVQCWSSGRWTLWQKVEASTAEEAALKLCGGPLRTKGTPGELRARVRNAESLSLLPEWEFFAVLNEKGLARATRALPSDARIED